MTVFTWDEQPYIADRSESARFQTEWMRPVPTCPLCDERFQRGQRVMGFKTASNGVLFHAECMKQHARGFMKDIAECLR